MIYIFFIWILSSVTCMNYLPRFESLPPPLVYYAENSDESPRVLTCKAWPSPPLTEIKMYSTMRPTTSDTNNPSESPFMKSAPLHPLDSEYVQGSSIYVRNVQQARALSKLDLHCLAKTQFGAVISRPFRVVEARIGAFPSATNAGEAHKVIKHFLHGNVAYVDCNPPVSYPPANIEFRLNDTLIHPSGRHKYIKRPNSQRVTLLIQAFEPRDQGYYRCTATNTITGEAKVDPLVHQLKIKSPQNKTPPFLMMSISGREVVGGTSVSGEIITVLEGTNVTLFCVMEGAPPPTVHTYKLRSSPSSQHRHVSDKEFGLLTITRVTADDEDSYICSESSASDTVQLKVKKRLSITQGPQDIRISELGSQARFTCLSNDENITPQWYFNGRLSTQTVQAGKDSSLHIAAVKKEELGVYQCVARSQDEWVTQVASLSLKNEQLSSKEDETENVGFKESKVEPGPHVTRGSRIKKNEDLAPPRVSTIFDNLAVLLQWDRQNEDNNLVRFYKVQFKSKKGGTKDWSSIQTLEPEIPQLFYYVTSQKLHAEYIYMFRVSAVRMGSDNRHSPWSRQVSFTHIYPAQPIIQRLDFFNTSHIRVQWQFTSAPNFPVTEFRILVRNAINEGNRMYFSKHWTFYINNPETTEAIIGALPSGFSYQAVVYGIKDTAPRKVTLFSPEVTLESTAVFTSPASSWHMKSNSESNTRLMFVILGSLAGLMVLVIIVLVLMCYCRERKSVVMHRLNRYKDPAKLIHNSEQAKAVQSSFLLASISAAANANNNNNHCKQQESNAGEHASLLSTGPDNVYYQQKRQPPSGGSGHDMSDGEGVSVQEQSILQEGGGGQHHMHPSTGMLTPQPPAITYYKASPGPASLPAGSLMRPAHHHPHQQQQPFPSQQYPPGYPQYPPQILYTNAGLVYSPGSYLGAMYPPQAQQQHQMVQAAAGLRQDQGDLRSQDGGESVYSYFSQTSTNNPQRQAGLQGATVETGSQTMNSNGSAGHRHHRRKRRKTAASGSGGTEADEVRAMQVKAGLRAMYPGTMGVREVTYDTPPGAHQDPRLINVPPGMVLMQAGVDQCWAGQPNNNTLTRRGTPTLFGEPPRIRDYSEYGIPHNQMMVGQPQQLAHLSQQNLHLHNQNLSGGYRDAQA